MHTLLQTIEDARPAALLIAAIGALGTLAAIAAVLAIAFRVRVALWVGVAATALGIVSAGLGALGVERGRAATNALVERQDLRPAQRRRLRREGYLAAQAPGRVGLLFAGLPLIAGIATMFVSARRRAWDTALPSDPDLPFRPRMRLGPPLGATASAVVVCTFDLFALDARVPGRDVAAERTAEIVVKDVEHVTAQMDVGNVFSACRELENDLEELDARLDRSLVPALPKASRVCVEQAIQAAAIRSPLSVVRHDLESVAISYFAKSDPALARLVASAVEEVRESADVPDEGLPLPGRVRDGGQLGVFGKLPPEVVQRIVRLSYGRLRRCYEERLRFDSSLHGRLFVRFVIGRDGVVSIARTVESQLRDPAVAACVVGVFESLAFPAPEAGIVPVSYPLVFEPGSGTASLR